MRLSAIPIATPPASASGIETMPPMSAAARTRSSRPGPTPSADAPGGLSGAKSIAAVAASAPAITQTIVDIFLMLMPERRAASALAADARIASPYFVRFRKSVERDDEERDDDDHRQLLPAHEHAADLPRPENAVGYGRTLGDVREDQLEEQQHLRGADQRDEQDHARRGEQPAHDRAARARRR